MALSSGFFDFKIIVSCWTIIYNLCFLASLCNAGFVIVVDSSVTTVNANYGNAEEQAKITLTPNYTSAVIYPLLDDPDLFNLVFSQSADLQFTGTGPFSCTNPIWIEVITEVRLSFAPAAQVVSGRLSMSILDENSAELSTGVNTIAQASVSPWFMDAFNNHTIIDSSPRTIVFRSYVSTDALSSTSQGNAYSKFDAIVTFGPASVPEPTSCLVAGVLFGSVVIGQRFRRRRGV